MNNLADRVCNRVSSMHLYETALDAVVRSFGAPAAGSADDQLARIAAFRAAVRAWWDAPSVEFTRAKLGIVRGLLDLLDRALVDAQYFLDTGDLDRASLLADLVLDVTELRRGFAQLVPQLRSRARRINRTAEQRCDA